MYIVAELCGQHSGSIRKLEQMALQAKMAGADAVKVQLYDTYKMLGENREKWEYLNISFEQLKEFKQYCDNLKIDLFSSFFDEERLEWCLKLNFPILKIASSVVSQWPELVKKAIATKKRVLISLGMYDWEKLGAPYKAENVEYLYCVSRYPGTLEEVFMPEFRNHAFFVGYSDHAPGNSAVYYAITRGAKIIEKHFTISKALQRETEKGHFCSMDYTDLVKIRNFADEFAILNKGK